MANAPRSTINLIVKLKTKLVVMESASCSVYLQRYKNMQNCPALIGKIWVSSFSPLMKSLEQFLSQFFPQASLIRGEKEVQAKHELLLIAIACVIWL